MTDAEKSILPTSAIAALQVPPPKPGPSSLHELSQQCRADLFMSGYKPSDRLLRWIRSLTRTSPRASNFSTLGMTLYRAGAHGEAIKACSEAVSLSSQDLWRFHRAHPGDYAILAMSYFQLGNILEAKRYRELLNESMKRPYARDPECLLIVSEVDRLMDSE